MRDLHNQIRILRGVSPVAVGTTGTGKTSVIVDRKDYDAVEAVFAYGTITATNAAFTATLLHGDVTGTMTSVADTDLIGTEALAGISAGTPRTSGSNKNVTKRLGYTGLKRYVQAKIVSTITAGTPIGIDFVLGMPKTAPVTNP